MNRFEFNTGDHKEEEEKVLVGRSYGKEVLYRFRKNKGAWISFIYSLMFIFTMLLVDILYGVIDPRIRLAKGE